MIAYHRDGKPVQTNPPAESVLKPGDMLIVMDNEIRVEQLRQLAKA